MSRQSEEEVLRRIEATRERMGETIERIGDRVHPDRVQHELKTRAREQVDELKHTAKRKAKNTMDDVQHGVRDTGRGLWDTIRENPVPAGMVGVGLAWLMANGSRHSDDTTYRSSAYPFAGTTGYSRQQAARNRYRPVESASYGHNDDLAYDHDFDDDDHSAIGDAADQVKAKGSDAMEDAREKGQKAAHSAREKGEELADTAREKGHQAADAARNGMRQARSTARGWASDAEYRARRAERRVEHAVQDNPFAAGAMAMALGLAAGLMIPETDREREMMGPARERLKDRAETKARSAANKAQDIARETASKSAKRAVDEVWSEAGSKSGDSTERMAAEGNVGSENAVREPGR